MSLKKPFFLHVILGRAPIKGDRTGDPFFCQIKPLDPGFRRDDIMILLIGKAIDGRGFLIKIPLSQAPVAELVDASDSKSDICMDVGVRLSPGAPLKRF